MSRFQRTRFFSCPVDFLHIYNFDIMYAAQYNSATTVTTWQSVKVKLCLAISPSLPRPSSPRSDRLILLVLRFPRSFAIDASTCPRRYLRLRTLPRFRGPLPLSPSLLRPLLFKTTDTCSTPHPIHPAFMSNHTAPLSVPHTAPHARHRTSGCGRCPAGTQRAASRSRTRPRRPLRSPLSSRPTKRWGEKRGAGTTQKREEKRGEERRDGTWNPCGGRFRRRICLHIVSIFRAE